MYRYYGDYLKALEIRTAYIDTLVDKYGEDDFMKKLQLNSLDKSSKLEMFVLFSDASSVSPYSFMTPMDVVRCETVKISGNWFYLTAYRKKTTSA